jgi:DNA polymerase III subunit beta
MKFSVLSSDLQKALARIIGVVPSKSTLQILENVLFDLRGGELTLTASDLELSMSVTLKVEGMEDGRVTVPAKILNETMRALPSTDVTFVADKASHAITVKTGQGSYRMSGDSAVNFPEEEQVAEEFSVELEAQLLRSIVTKTSFAVTTDDLRPSMMGVLMQWREGAFRAVATDGHRLVQLRHSGVLATAETGGDREVIIPAKALNILSRSLDQGPVSVVFGRTHVRFSFLGMRMISRIIDERYPNYESVIPLDNDITLEVNRTQLQAVVNRCAIFSNAVTHQVRFAINGSELTVSAEDQEYGGEARETIPASYSGQSEMLVGFNSRYVVDALSHLDSENVTFSFSSPTRAGLLRPTVQPEDLDILMLVMPLRLNS